MSLEYRSDTFRHISTCIWSPETNYIYVLILQEKYYRFEVILYICKNSITLTIVLPFMSHMTRGLGWPVTRQQKRAYSPSSTVTGSGRLTNTGGERALASSGTCSGTLQ